MAPRRRRQGPKSHFGIDRFRSRNSAGRREGLVPLRNQARMAAHGMTNISSSRGSCNDSGMDRDHFENRPEASEVTRYDPGNIEVHQVRLRSGDPAGENQAPWERGDKSAAEQGSQTERSGKRGETDQDRAQEMPGRKTGGQQTLKPPLFTGVHLGPPPEQSQQLRSAGEPLQPLRWPPTYTHHQRVAVVAIGIRGLHREGSDDRPEREQNDQEMCQGNRHAKTLAPRDLTIRLPHFFGRRNSPIIILVQGRW